MILKKMMSIRVVSRLWSRRRTKKQGFYYLPHEVFSLYIYSAVWNLVRRDLRQFFYYISDDVEGKAN